MTTTRPIIDDVEQIVADDRTCLWHHIKPPKLVEQKEQMIIVEGRGLIVKDIRGREYLDAASGGVWSVIIGYGRESVAAAVYQQLKTMPYWAGGCGNVPSIRLARALLDRLPGMSKVFFSNSGSEANEKIFKMVRQAAVFHPARKGKFKVLYRHRDYHGTTLAALSATGQPERKIHYEPLCQGFAEFPAALCYRCAFGKTYPGCDLDCAAALESLILAEGPDSVGAVLVEPITAGGGILVPVPEYYPRIQEICRKYDVWLVMDEVVCGFGRTGRFWGHEHFDVAPDALTLAKGLAGGYEPLSASVVRPEIFDVFVNDLADQTQRLNYFRDISTYGGCAGPAAAALESLRIIEAENLVENSRVMGARLLEGLTALADLPIVGDVRGRGLFCGIEFVRDKQTKEPISEAHMAKLVGDVAGEGVLVGRTASSLPGMNTVMNFAPALVATAEQIDAIVAAVGRAIQKNLKPF
jgi:taurine-pyruvate aminotransferase